MDSCSSPIRILSIVGCGRSGSTLLDILLGNHPQIEGLGELGNLVYRSWKLGEYCACGRPAVHCEFWSAVRRIWHQRVGHVDLDEFQELQDRFETPRPAWRVFLRRRREPRRFAEYARLTLGLFESIREVSQKAVLVDSSKHPTRTLALSMVPGLELYTVHLVRDPRGVVWSLKKSYQKDLESGISQDLRGKPAWRSSVAWTRVNIEAAMTCRLLGSTRSVRVRYEDLMGDLPAQLGRIGALVGLDLVEMGQAVAGGAAVRPNHTVQGNRMRMSDSIKVRVSTEWMEKLAAADRAACWACAGWLMLSYGYGLDT